MANNYTSTQTQEEKEKEKDMNKSRKTPQQKMLTKYKTVVKVLDDLYYASAAMSEKDEYEFAYLVLDSIGGKCREHMNGIVHDHGRVPALETDWAAKTPRAVIEEVLKIIRGDGHTMFDSQAFLDAGLPENVVTHYTRIRATDLSNPRGVMTDKTGNLVSHIEGIYGLDLLRGMVRSLGVPASQALGRGFEARELTHNIEQHFKTGT